jgi:hypothetical protein
MKTSRVCQEWDQIGDETVSTVHRYCIISSEDSLEVAWLEL